MPTADGTGSAVAWGHAAGAVLAAQPHGHGIYEGKLWKQICDLVLAENQRRGPDEKPLYILYDQIYWLLTFGQTQHHDPVSLRPALRDYVVYIDGLSKCFAATGVRVGYTFGPKVVIDKMKAPAGPRRSLGPQGRAGSRRQIPIPDGSRE
ncbi:MAG: aminotransferase class I/II-fold pyridoxal phosphate-dependent enzyme [Hymenobacter sp.]